jgi:hypothetical protein
MTPHYRLPAPVVGDSASGTARSSQAAALPPARLVTSARADTTARHWNHLKTERCPFSKINFALRYVRN